MVSSRCAARADAENGVIMKIKSIRVQVARVPLDEPLAGGSPYFRSHNQFVLVRIDTDEGVEGIGVTFLRRRARGDAQERASISSAR